MKKTPDQTNTAPAPDPEVVVEILINGTLIDGCHHAGGKTMRMPKSKADVLVGLTPPAVKIIGV
jgi:hypothetical protein